MSGLLQDYQLEGLRWIDQQEADAISLLKKWSRINSGTTNLDGLAQMHDELESVFSILADQAESVQPESGFSIDDKGDKKPVECGKLLRFRKRSDASFKILLCGHMDTVFPKDHPFQQVEMLDDNLLHGPGVADMKGGLIAMLLALQAWERTPVASSIGWEVLINSDEETGSLASAPFLAESAKRNQVGLVYEPALADGTLAGARKGSGNFTLVVRGKSAHAGREFHNGRNAIGALADAMVELNAINGVHADTTLNLGRISGGGALNSVADMAICKFNLRAEVAEHIDWAEGRIADCVAQINQRDGFNAELTGAVHRPAKVMSADTIRLFSLLEDCGAELGIEIRNAPTGGCCDGNNLAAEGLPNIDTLGVRGGNIHTDQEFMVLDSLVERAKLSFLFLNKLAETDDFYAGVSDHLHGERA